MSKTNFDPELPVIAVDITLEGKTDTKRRIRVVLDTGATYTMIPWEIAEALGYKPEISKEKKLCCWAFGLFVLKELQNYDRLSKRPIRNFERITYTII